MRARLAAAALAAWTAGCAHPYRPPLEPAEATARVRFETRATAFARLEVFARFHIDVRVYEENECPGRWSDGGTYLGRVEMEREGGSAEILVPTGRRLNFWASYSSSTIGATITCSLFHAFVPEAGHGYQFEYSGNRRQCEVRAIDLTTSTPVALMPRESCPQSL